MNIFHKATVILALAGASGSAFAHKGNVIHTHCSVMKDNMKVGIHVDGKTDNEQKSACGKIKGATWDATEALAVEGSAQDPGLQTSH